MRCTYSEADVDDIRVTGVHEGDAIIGDGGETLVCTADAVRFDAGDLVIPHYEIEHTRVDVDKSVAGFTTIAAAFGVVALLMGYVFTRFVVVGGGSVVSVVGGGSGLSAILSVYGCVWIRRLEVGERTVLQVDYGDESRAVFITDGDDDGLFTEIESRVRDRKER